MGWSEPGVSSRNNKDINVVGAACAGREEWVVGQRDNQGVRYGKALKVL